jgi:hypothetical protein
VSRRKGSPKTIGKKSRTIAPPGTIIGGTGIPGKSLTDNRVDDSRNYQQKVVL